MVDLKIYEICGLLFRAGTTEQGMPVVMLKDASAVLGFKSLTKARSYLSEEDVQLLPVKQKKVAKLLSKIGFEKLVANSTVANKEKILAEIRKNVAGFEEGEDALLVAEDAKLAAMKAWIKRNVRKLKEHTGKSHLHYYSIISNFCLKGREYDELQLEDGPFIQAFFNHYFDWGEEPEQFFDVAPGNGVLPFSDEDDGVLISKEREDVEESLANLKKQLGAAVDIQTETIETVIALLTVSRTCASKLDNLLSDLQSSKNSIHDTSNELADRTEILVFGKKVN